PPIFFRGLLTVNPVELYHNSVLMSTTFWRFPSHAIFAWYGKLRIPAHAWIFDASSSYLRRACKFCMPIIYG
ncbi:MAG: hypothetical protein ACE5PV_26950, partial [Candidatus Poribacteria bacterium]